MLIDKKRKILMQFTDFNLNENIQNTIKEIGFVEPSPIQKEAIPIILAGNDIIAQAQTGTGKTAAFGLPIISNMHSGEGVQCLVIVPTRELAMQVSDELYKFGKTSNIRTATVYGGTPYRKQIERIAQASIVVATPGRLQDLLDSGKIDLKPSIVVLDEADEMLDMGFLDEIRNIFKHIPSERQTLMFSATMPASIKKLAVDILKNHKTVTVTKSESTNTSITQLYYVVQENERDDALVRLIDYNNPNKCIIFCRMKKEVDRLVSHLTSQGFKVSGLHGDMEQKQREVTIRGFKKSGIDILVATDVAARGLDVNDITHVFNYHIPFDSESYVHRIGRTARAGKKGDAITLITPDELRTLKRIEKDVGAKIITKVIPTRQELQNNQEDKFIEEIKLTEVTERAVDLVKNLLHDLDIVSIAHLLATMLQSNKYVQGKDSIGLTLEEVENLIAKASSYKNSNYSRGGYNRGRSRSNSRFGGNSTGNRKNYKSRGGYSDDNRGYTKKFRD